VGESAREYQRRRRPRGAGPRALKDDYWQSLQDLFTRDVTGRDLRQLVQHDARDTVHFFTREIDLADLKDAPWHHRYPLALWRIFEAMAYRLTPARRIFFALAVPLLAFGWARFLVGQVLRGPFRFPPIEAWETWLLAAASILFLLLVVELKDKLTLKGDLEIARQIQFGLLPFEPYSRCGVVIESAMRPANTVGGDYFDVIEIGDDRLAVVVGDVAGKGMPAALLMALLQGSLRTLLSAGFRGAELLARLNEHLCANIPANRLITLFYSEVDAKRGTLRYVNAGHNAPFLIRAAGAMERLPATAVALGILTGEAFEAHEARISDGDRLLLYTDGVTETFDPKDVEYGEERLAAFLDRQRRLALRALIDGVIEDVLAFASPERPRDDMTLLVLSPYGGPPPLPGP
jgi:serine phosphatase RsbU (regulator of sigma subunit)